MTKLRWGIVATGNVATDFTEDLMLSNNSVAFAVASRTLEKSKAFAERFGMERAYDNYEALYQDPDVDIVYIATPHTGHYENTIKALSGGKHVLCEKPLGMNPQQIAACLALAEKQQRFLMEAVWMVFFPAIGQVSQWLSEGRIGQPNLLEAAFCFTAPQDPQSRLFNPQLGGGALLDIGLYPLFLATLLLGEASLEQAYCTQSSTGVDVFNQLLCRHKGGAVSSLQASLQFDKPCSATIQGDKGYIRIEHRFFCPSSVSLHRYGEPAVTLDFPYQGHGYQFEIAEVEQCVSEGKLTSARYPNALCLHNHDLLSQALEQFGLTYP